MPLADNIIAKSEREQYIPVRLCIRDGKTQLVETGIQGGGDYSNLSKSDGLLRCPENIKELKAGSIAEFLPWSDL